MTMPPRAACLIPLLVIAVGCTPATVKTPASTSSSPIHLPQGSERVTLDPGDFVATVDHPFWPMRPGNVWIYRKTGADGTVLRVKMTVTGGTKRILGIEATAVHEKVTTDGDLVADTIDWYAQDTAGTLWFLGENAMGYKNGEVVSTSGSWEAGVDRAQPGIILPAEPQEGMTYRKEYYAGKAEDKAEVVSLDEKVDVRAGSFEGVLLTKQFSALNPGVVEQTFYARGLGPVLVVRVSGGKSRKELISIQRN